MLGTQKAASGNSLKYQYGEFYLEADFIQTSVTNMKYFPVIYVRYCCSNYLKYAIVLKV
jgi:hypothetical protein